MKKTQFVIAAATEAKQPGEGENQDSILTDVFPSQNGRYPCALFIVADGVGGHKNGNLASQTAVKTIHQDIINILEKIPPEPAQAVPFLQEQLLAAINTANEKIYARAKEENIRMASTVTCAFLYGPTAIIANVGDSRTYRYNGSALDQITIDHSVVDWMVRQGHITSAEAAQHPYKNVIMQALGSHETPEPDVFVCTLKENEALVLCSDGIWDTLSDEDITFYLKESDSLDMAMANITTAAQDHSDDLSLILAQLCIP